MQPVAEILNKMLLKHPAGKKIRSQFIIDAWPDVVGEHIAKKTSVVSLRKGVMLVKVSDSVWAQHLQLQKKQIMDKLNNHVKSGLLQDIRFIVGSLQSKGKKKPCRTARIKRPWLHEELTDKDREKIDDSFKGVKLLPEIRESLEIFLTAQKKKQNYILKNKNPQCKICGLPLIKTAGKTYCLGCKNEGHGQNST